MTEKQTTKKEYYPKCSHPWLYLISIDRVSSTIYQKPEHLLQQKRLQLLGYEDRNLV